METIITKMISDEKANTDERLLQPFVQLQMSGLLLTSKKSQTKSPARTPKRDSPATIAAKGAPGWEKFLGGKTSTVQFTSEEVQKLKSRQQQYKLNNQQPQPKPRTSASGLLESSFEEPPVPQMLPPKIGLHSKSTPSLEQGPQLSPRSTASEPQPKTSGGRWKNSLDSLHQSDAIQRGFTVNQVVNSPPQSQIWHPQTSHSHRRDCGHGGNGTHG